MTLKYPYPLFSFGERDRRWKSVRTRMADAGIDVIVCPNNTGHSTDFQANSRYLSHVGGGGDADIAVVFPLEGEVTAIATSAAPRWPTVQNWTTDVREARRRYGQVAVERLKELNVDKGRIGIVGLPETGGTRTPEGIVSFGFWKLIRESFPEADIVDASHIMIKQRYVKSDEELAALQRSLDLIELAIEAKIATARQGVKDYEVWAAAHYAMMRHGSEIPVHCNWASGNNPIRTLTRPSHRVLERGDLIINELEANWMGYRAQAVQPVFVGEADPIHMELIKVQRDVFNFILAHARPGVTVGEIAKLTTDEGKRLSPRRGPIAEATTKLTMHGRGAGDDGPIITGHSRNPEQLSVPLQENMVFTCKPSAISADGRSVCTWGDTVVITKTGGRRLGSRAHDLAVAGD